MKKNSKFARLDNLQFSGQVCFVGDEEADEKYSNLLLEEKVIGVDFEWQADSGKSNNLIAIAQVCTKSTCFLWLLFKFASPPPGLHKLLLSHSVVKVGCCFRVADLRKLGISGLAVPHQGNSLPVGFIDVIELKCNGKGVYVKSLVKLVAIWLLKVLPNDVEVTKADWSQIETNADLLNYAVLDAYAVLLIFEQSDQFKTLATDSSATKSSSADQIAEALLTSNPGLPEASSSNTSNPS